MGISLVCCFWEILEAAGYNSSMSTRFFFVPASSVGRLARTRCLPVLVDVIPLQKPPPKTFPSRKFHRGASEPGSAKLQVSNT